jgi:hypothetical protein
MLTKTLSFRRVLSAWAFGTAVAGIINDNSAALTAHRRTAHWDVMIEKTNPGNS